MKTTSNSVHSEFDMAVEHHRAGRLNEARALYQKFLHTPDALHLLGVMAREIGNLEEAAHLNKRAIVMNPKVAAYHQHLGVVYYDLARYEESAECYHVAISLQPHCEVTLRNLGNTYLRLGRFEESLKAYKRALEIESDAPATLLGMASLLCERGEYHESIVYGLKLLEKNPEMAEVYQCLALSLLRQRKVYEARLCIEKGLSINSNGYNGWSILLELLQMLGNPVEVRDYAQKGLKVNSKWHQLFSSALSASQYCPGNTPEFLFGEHLDFAKLYEEPLLTLKRSYTNQLNPNRKLKIGYISPEFRKHAMQYFIEPIVKEHNRAAFEIYCYYNCNVNDEVTERFKLLADCWIPCAKMSDDQLAERIRQDQIDILIDLSGHCGDNRLLTFARKPAPVQVTWMGYPNTTGLKAMDYRITDELMDPVGVSEKYHTETLVRLPYSAGYTPPTEAPEVNQLPALTSPGVTFACLNNPAKINLPLVGLWAQILNALPDSRLILGSVEFPETRALLLSYFAHYGIDESRLQLLAPMSMRDYLAFHHQIDLALDPFPYCGGTSTNHSLWMGVPVLTRTGDTSVSRIGAVLMHRVGLPEFITQTPEDYVSRAIEIASDLPALNRIRQGLRERMSTQAAMDPNVFIGHVEDAFRKMWQRWCDTQLSQSK